MREEVRITKEKAFIEKATRMENHSDCDYSQVHFVNMATPVVIKCNRCGRTFSQSPKNHLRGQSCPYCGAEKAKNNRKNGFEAFLSNAERRFGDRYSFPHIEDEYENNRSTLTVKCNRCGTITSKVAMNFLASKDGFCHKCNDDGDYIAYDELKERFPDANFVPFEGKRSVKTDTAEILCEKHGITKRKIGKMLKDGGCGCRFCSLIGKKRLRFDDIKDRLDEILGKDITYDPTTFVKVDKPMVFVCKTCGGSFERKPSTYLFGKLVDKCPICGKKRRSDSRRKTTEQFIEDAKRVYGENTYDFSDTVYTSSSEYVTVRCLRCGRTFTKEANSFLSGNGCPYHNCNSSSREREIADYVRSLGFAVENNDRNVLNGHELDVYVPSKRLAIEFDGIYWHNELNKPKDYHLSKTELCERNGIRLIHIFEDEWAYRKDVWKSMLRNILGLTTTRIYARTCEIRNVDSAECGRFLDENHVQGKCPSSMRYGLYRDGELVSLMTFGKSRHFVGDGKYEYELLRFCNKRDIDVPGGASKLLGHFVKEAKPKSLVSYADRRWSDGNLYRKLGFELYNVSPPNYYYVIDGRRRNRFNYRKGVLTEKYGCPEGMSERDFCRSMKWYRIYDCGCLCYRMLF